MLPCDDTVMDRSCRHAENLAELGAGDTDVLAFFQCFKIFFPSRQVEPVPCLDFFPEFRFCVFPDFPSVAMDLVETESNPFKMGVVVLPLGEKQLVERGEEIGQKMPCHHSGILLVILSCCQSIRMANITR